MFSVTSMGTYGNYFVYGGAYYAWVNERHSFQSMADSKFVTSHENREYIFFPKRGGGAVEGWIPLKEMMLYFGQPARAIMSLGSQSI